MKSWGNRTALHEDIVSRLQEGEYGTLPPPTLPDYQLNWMAQLTLLYGVPVEYLVPDMRMLPTESLRFFFLDRNWLDRMVDGAMSVGVLSSKDEVFNKSFFKDIYGQIDQAQNKLRASLRDASNPEGIDPGGPVSGFIMRSQVVADFPGMEIEATKNDVKLPILRMDTLSSTTMICLFAGVPDKVNFIQPGEGLNFGVFSLDSSTVGNDFYLFLRGLGAGGHEAGKQIQDNHGVKLKAKGSFRKGTDQPSRVVNVSGLVSNIEAALESVSPPGENKKLTPGGFAIELTKTAQSQPYQNNGKGFDFPICSSKIA